MGDKQDLDELTGALRDLLIVQLLQAGATQHDTRTIAKCGMKRVSEIAQALKGKGQASE